MRLLPRPPNCWSLLLELLDGYCGWTRLPALELLVDYGCCGTSCCWSLELLELMEQ